MAIYTTYITIGLLVLAAAVSESRAGIDNNEIQDEYETMFGGVKIYAIEERCAMVGGLCVHKTDCIHPTTGKGLCPENQPMGVECCYELDTKPAPCAQYQGMCMSRCHKRLMRPGTDCGNGEVCCVLIN